MDSDSIAKAFQDSGSEAARKIKDALGELQGNTMSMKTAKDFQTVDAAKRNGILDSNGNVTALGRENYLNAASQDFARSAELLKQTDDPVAMERMLKGLEEKGFGTNRYRDPITGKALTGQAMRDAIASGQSMLVSHGKGMVGDNGEVFTGVSLNGHVQGQVKKGLSSTKDNSNNIIEGTHVKTEDPDYQAALAQSHGNVQEALRAVRASRAIDHALSKRGLITHSVGYIGDKLKNFDKKHGTHLYKDFKDATDDPQKLENFMSKSGTAIVAALTGAAYNKAFKTEEKTTSWQNKKFDPENPNYVKQQDGTYKDEKGNIFSVDKDGNMVNEDGNIIKEKVTKTEKIGGIRRTGRALGKKVNQAGKSLRKVLSSQPLDETDDPIDSQHSNHEHGKKPDTVNDGLHDNSFHSNSTSNSTKSTENVKDAAEEKVENAKNTIDSIDNDMKDLANTPNKQVTRDKMAEIVKQHLEDAAPGSEEQKALRALKSKISNKSARVTPQDFEDAGIGKSELQDNGIQIQERSYKDKTTGKTNKFETFDFENSGEDIKADAKLIFIFADCE